MMFHCNEIPFFLSFSYSVSRDAFIIFILLDDTIKEANKYTAHIWIETDPEKLGPERPEPERITFHQKVVSIEETTDTDEPCLPNSKYIVIPYTEMKKFFFISKNDDSDIFPEENGLYTVSVPLQVETITPAME